MRSFNLLKTIATTGLICGALAFIFPADAQAGGYGGYGHGGYGHGADYGHGGHSYQPQYHWKTIVTYETVKKQYIDYVTKYDHCGHPYRAEIVRYEYVQVPVTKQVKVFY